MQKKLKTIICLCFIFTLFDNLKAQNDTSNVQIKGDSVKIPVKNAQNDEKIKLYELKQDIERLNAKSSVRKKVVITDTVYVKKEKRILEPPPRLYRHELGIETGAFFNQIFRVFGLVKDTQNFPVSPYVISYKYRPNVKGAARLGLGLRTYKSTENKGAFADSRVQSNQFYDARLGYEFNIPLDDRWLCYMGIDGIWGFSNESIALDSGFDKNVRSSKANSYGVAFVLGIRYDFSWRVSLGSEMGFAFLNINGEEINEFTANPQFNSIIRKFNNQQTKFNGPGNVYLSIRF
jgi:hypothetical protein